MESSAAMPDMAGSLTWLPGALSGANTLRGVELDSRRLFLQHFDNFFSILAMVLFWMLACCAKMVLALLPALAPVPVLTKALQKLSAAGDEYSVQRPVRSFDAGSRNTTLCKSPIGRALTQVLALVNDVPASSNKYAFLHDLADRVIEENRVEGVKYNSINQAALRRGFTRTMNLLGRSLESRRQQYTILGRLARHLSSGAIFPMGPFARIRSVIGLTLSPLYSWMSRPNFNEAAHLTNLADPDMAEKFAKELLWITEKLLDCGGMEEAVQQWSSVPSLAELSLCASPKVQKSLVRLSALLCKGLVGNANIPQEACLKLVILWLPLLCNATHGGDGPIFNSLEKGDAERQLERAILSLPEADQEQILATWVQEYAMSQSDWPNLLNCYNTWCYSTRKLELDMSKVVMQE